MECSAFASSLLTTLLLSSKELKNLLLLVLHLRLCNRPLSLYHLGNRDLRHLLQGRLRNTNINGIIGILHGVQSAWQMV